MGRLRGCLSRIGCLTLLVLGTTVGWLYRAEIEAWWEEMQAGPTAVEEGASPAERNAAEDGRFGIVGDSTAAAGATDTSAGDGAARDGRADGPGADARDDRASEASGSAVDRFLAAAPPATVRLDAEELADLLARRVEPGLPEGISRKAAVNGDSTLTI